MSGICESVKCTMREDGVITSRCSVYSVFCLQLACLQQEAFQSASCQGPQEERGQLKQRCCCPAITKILDDLPASSSSSQITFSLQHTYSSQTVPAPHSHLPPLAAEEQGRGAEWGQKVRVVGDGEQFPAVARVTGHILSRPGKQLAFDKCSFLFFQFCSSSDYMFFCPFLFQEKVIYEQS